jgi:phosphoserine phosphatase RsbU/P
MNTVYLLSFAFIAFACLPLWYDASRRKEYGNRPKLLLASIAIFVGMGILSAVSIFVVGDDSTASFPLLFTLQLLYVADLFLVEYSVHEQRIKKSMLFDGFLKKIKLLALGFAGAVAVSIGAWFLFYYSSPDSAALGFYKLLVAVCVIVLYAFTLVLFNLEEGIIRQKRYPFVAAIVVTAVAFIFSAVAFANATRVYPVFIVLNLVFGIRVFHEYFLYRMGHLNDMHSRQVASEKARTELINKVLFSNAEDDLRMIKETLAKSLERLQNSLPNSNLVFRSMMAYRRNGTMLAVDSEELILDYCVPLIDSDRLKQMHGDVLHKYIQSQTFDIAALGSAETADGLDFASAAVRQMILERRPIVVDPLPSNMAAIFKLVLLYPVFNQSELSGMLVLFKTDYDYIFPQENVILGSLVENLALTYTLIDGKKVQDEKNRLNREMDIAKNIQTSILPREFDLEGYEVKAGMITATEVGGDLYDFVRTDFGNYFDIADVSGHGLPAGIMALTHMAALHGALRACESVGKELSITGLYDIVNRVLVEINQKRIGSDKFMTCNLLVAKGDRFSYAGSHLTGLVYRKATDSVEELSGMMGAAAFLGISAAAVSDQSLGGFEMATGDALLLYTDGLIEARDSNGDFLGLQNLGEVFRRNAGLGVEAMKQAIFDWLKGFAENGDRKKYGGNYADDVSIMIVKKREEAV